MTPFSFCTLSLFQWEEETPSSVRKTRLLSFVNKPENSELVIRQHLRMQSKLTELEAEGLMVEYEGDKYRFSFTFVENHDKVSHNSISLRTATLAIPAVCQSVLTCFNWTFLQKYNNELTGKSGHYHCDHCLFPKKDWTDTAIIEGQGFPITRDVKTDQGEWWLMFETHNKTNLRVDDLIWSFDYNHFIHVSMIYHDGVTTLILCRLNRNRNDINTIWSYRSSRKKF